MHKDYEINYMQSLLSSVWPDWHITRELGKGSYGKVYEILRNDLGTDYVCALKVLQMESDDADIEPTTPLRREGEGAAGTREGQQGMLAPHEGCRKGNQGLSAPCEGRSEGFQGLSAPDARSLHLLAPTSRLPFSRAQEEELEEFVVGVSTEIDAMMQLKGAPNVVSIEDYAVLREKGRRTIFIRMEKLETLEKHAAAQGGLRRQEALRAGLDICRALALCEEKNILHRDIKPSNIFYSDKAGYKLGDFGISRTMDSIFEKKSMSGIGTIQFMAPEIYRGEKYNNTVDIYALGVTLYTMFNGGCPPLYPRAAADASVRGGDPFPPADLCIVRRPHLTDAGLHEANMRRLSGAAIPPPSQADERLAKALCMACNPDPSLRFRTAAAFQAALQFCLDGGGGGTEPPPAPRLPIPFLAAAVILLLAGAGFFFKMGNSRTPSQASGTAMETGGDGSSAGPDEDEAEETSWSILCFDGDGNEIARLEGGDGRVGEEVTASAPDMEGFRLSEDAEATQALVLAEDPAENIFIFDYAEKPSNYVEFADPALAYAVRRSMGIPQGQEITLSAARAVDTLDLSGLAENDYGKIADLTGLSNFTCLETLILDNNLVSDISELAGLTHLKDLRLEVNMVEDVEPLRDLVSLTKLDLEANNIEDVSPLMGLTNLEMLDFRKNYVTDIEGIQNLTKLDHLYMGNNRISDVKWVAPLTRLTYLSIGYNEVSRVDVLKNLTNIHEFVVKYNKIEDITVIQNFPKLYWLEISGNPLNRESEALVDSLPDNIDVR